MITSSTAAVKQQQSDSYPMGLEEARKVLWLRNYPRPLGELYDEGYLNRSRLEWAAAKAYDPRLKQAAQILLAQPEPGKTIGKNAEKLRLELPSSDIPIGISLADARATQWPFPPFKDQSMGTLVETKQLLLKDLGFAAENAWDKRVRQAARALMLVRLNQSIKEPPPAAGFIKVVSGGRSYAERKQLQLSFIEGIIVGVVFGLIVPFLIWWFAQRSSTHESMTLSEVVKSPVGIAALVVLGVIIGLVGLGFFLFDRLLARMDRQIDNHREGQKGEERVVEVILQTLDGNWSLFRNIQLPGHNKADLDAVLVGPPGVWVLEIKNFNGKYRNTGEQWEYFAGKRWNLYKKSPSRQVWKGAIHLANFLKADGISQWVEAVVVWANRESPLVVENPSVAVWALDRLPDELGNIWQEGKVSAAAQVRIVEKLAKLCQRQEKARKKEK